MSLTITLDIQRLPESSGAPEPTWSVGFNAATDRVDLWFTDNEDVAVELHLSPQDARELAQSILNIVPEKETKT